MKKLLDKLRDLMRRDDGASAVEYGLLVALIAVVIAGTVVILGDALQNRFHDPCSSISKDANGNPTQTCPGSNHQPTQGS